MIVVETLLRDIFSQLPQIADNSGKLFTVKYHWGGQDDMNLYMKQESGNKTPLIWLVQNKGKQISTEQSRRIKLIIAKDSENKTAMNPAVWEREFETVLDPLLDNVLKCLYGSGRTNIVNNEYDVYREANYSEYERDSESKTIDHWNVITLESDILFTESSACIQTINFN